MAGYSFNASAIGLGAVLKSDGIPTVIPSLASVALAPTGGEGSSVVENYNHLGISFTRAESRVFGAQVSDDIYITQSDVYITNLNIRDRLRIAVMALTLSSTRNVTEPDSMFDVRVTYRGISVDDAEVVPHLDLGLCEAPRYSDVLTMLNEDRPGYAELFGIQETTLQNVIADPSPSEPLSGTLVKNLSVPPGIELVCSGHKVAVPGVGLAHFGEFLFKPGRRRVNLLRISFGDTPVSQFANAVLATGGDEGGDLTAGSAEGNGTPPTGP